VGTKDSASWEVSSRHPFIERYGFRYELPSREVRSSTREFRCGRIHSDSVEPDTEFAEY
jgi:hypothetical protein